jgi:hypothetical protein
MVVQGLEKTGLAEAKEMAFVLAERRVRVVMGSNKGFKTVLSNNSNNSNNFLC